MAESTGKVKNYGQFVHTIEPIIFPYTKTRGTI